MSGHNRWSKVKHIKGAADAKKGKIFTKLAKEIIVSVRLGGGSPDTNARLRAALQLARAASMSKDTIERAIKKGLGELEGGTIEEALYEGYGPAGVAILVEAATDNKNRTVSDIRRVFKTGGGHLGETGSVAYLFERCGQLIFDAEAHKEEIVMEVALQAGAKDIHGGENNIEVIADASEVYKVKEQFDRVGIHPISSGLGYAPKSVIKIQNKDEAAKLISLLEEIEDHDDVQKVYSNFDMDDKLLKELVSK